MTAIAISRQIDFHSFMTSNNSPIVSLLTLGERVRYVRESRQLTQKQLAKMIGVSQQHVDKVERNIIKRPKNIADYARILDVPVEWLQFGKPELDKLTAEGVEVALAWQELPESVKEKIKSAIFISSGKPFSEK